MINENFIFIGLLADISGSISYLIDTVKGRIQPNRVSWLLWAVAPLIAFAAEIKQGVGLLSLTTFIVGFTPLIIFIGTFVNKKAYWKLGKLDIICGVLSVLGLILWALTRVGDIAILFSIIADALAALPTLIKSYKEPESENYGPFVGALFLSGITLLATKNWSFANYGFPLYIFIIDLSIIMAIKFGRRKLA